MNKEEPWITFVALYAFAAFIGSLITLFFLEAVGAINVVDLSIAPVQLTDVLGPLISAVGIVATALIATNGWVIQQTEQKEKRLEELNFRRSMAKENRIPLPVLLDEISDACKDYVSSFCSTTNLASGSPVLYRVGHLPTLGWPADYFSRIQAAAHLQEDPLLSSLIFLVHDMQIKTARTNELRRKLTASSGHSGSSFSGRVWAAEFHREIYDVLVIATECSALFAAARDVGVAPYDGDLCPSYKQFDMNWELTSAPLFGPFEAYVKQRRNLQSCVALRKG